MKDYYAVLGVIPDAEAVVITAAYRALASMYHPDRWKGDISEATDRMAEINVAYGTLGDTVKRKEYDALRPSTGATFSTGDDQRDEAFDEALDEMQADWLVAVSIFPDLANIRTHLSKIAHRLAFAYVTVLIETKQFQRRSEIAFEMEENFLISYFGSNPDILEFVRELIALGKRDAVKAVNRYVEVLGSGIDAFAVIQKIKKEFDIDAARQEAYTEKSRQKDVSELRESLKANKFVHLAIELAGLLGYEVHTIRKGLFRSAYKVIKKTNGEVVQKELDYDDLVDWAIRVLC